LLRKLTGSSQLTNPFWRTGRKATRTSAATTPPHAARRE
jgi:hypothetical protein